MIGWGSDLPYMRSQRGRLERQSHKTSHFRATTAHIVMVFRMLETKTYKKQTWMYDRFCV